MRGESGEVFTGRGEVPVSSGLQRLATTTDPQVGGMSHFDYRAKTTVDRSERKPDRRNAGNDGRSTGANHCRGAALTGAAVAVGTSEITGSYRGQQVGAGLSRPVANNGLDADGAQVTRPAARPWRSFGFLRYSPRDLKSHWRSLRAASLTPLDIPATVSVIKRAAALACHRFVTMEWIMSTGEPVERITS